jgi:biotin carboxylase
MSTFVQLGATRDGLDPYLPIARSRGMQTVLIETPDYIQFRQYLGRQTFDQTIAVEHPANTLAVVEAISRLAETPILIVPGFERYIYSAYAVSSRMHILPSSPKNHFVPPHKGEQRQAISRKPSSIHQPGYLLLSDTSPSNQHITGVSYPLVLKPLDGGGGLGVFLVANPHELAQALTQIQTLTNYDGGAFSGLLVEEYVSGLEYSVQGVARNGVAQILALCKKSIITENATSDQTYLGFRETSHIAIAGDSVDNQLRQFVQDCVDTFEYKNGPFHIDIVQAAEGYYFLEMGFRLSGGGIARLVELVSGYNWAEEAFTAYLGLPSETPHMLNKKPLCAGNLATFSHEEITLARRLQEEGHAMTIQLLSPPPANIPPSLTADIVRNTAFLARITASAPTVEEVTELLQRCSLTRITSTNPPGTAIEQS